MSESTSSFLQRWLVTTVGVLLAAGVIDGVRADTIVSLLAASLLLGILNAFLRPVLMILALPLLVLTLGLFTFVINALLLYVVGNLVKGFHVQSFWAALKASVLISIVSVIASSAFGKKELPPHSSGPPPGRPPPGTGSGPVIDV
jgi:putative membrane protein